LGHIAGSIKPFARNSLCSPAPSALAPCAAN
jgi:hypothetical protein